MSIPSALQITCLKSPNCYDFLGGPTAVCDNYKKSAQTCDLVGASVNCADDPLCINPTTHCVKICDGFVPGDTLVWNGNSWVIETMPAAPTNVCFPLCGTGASPATCITICPAPAAGNTLIWNGVTWTFGPFPPAAVVTCTPLCGDGASLATCVQICSGTCDHTILQWNNVAGSWTQMDPPGDTVVTAGGTGMFPSVTAALLASPCKPYVRVVGPTAGDTNASLSAALAGITPGTAIIYVDPGETWQPTITGSIVTGGKSIVLKGSGPTSSFDFQTLGTAGVTTFGAGIPSFLVDNAEIKTQGPIIDPSVPTQIQNTTVDLFNGGPSFIGTAIGTRIVFTQLSDVILNANAGGSTTSVLIGTTAPAIAAQGFKAHGVWLRGNTVGTAINVLGPNTQISNVLVTSAWNITLTGGTLSGLTQDVPTSANCTLTIGGTTQISEIECTNLVVNSILNYGTNVKVTGNLTMTTNSALDLSNFLVNTNFVVNFPQNTTTFRLSNGKITGSLTYTPTTRFNLNNLELSNVDIGTLDIPDTGASPANARGTLTNCRFSNCIISAATSGGNVSGWFNVFFTNCQLPAMNFVEDIFIVGLPNICENMYFNNCRFVGNVFARVNLWHMNNCVVEGTYTQSSSTAGYYIANTKITGTASFVAGSNPTSQVTNESLRNTYANIHASGAIINMSSHWDVPSEFANIVSTSTVIIDGFYGNYANITSLSNMTISGSNNNVSDIVARTGTVTITGAYNMFSNINALGDPGSIVLGIAGTTSVGFNTINGYRISGSGSSINIHSDSNTINGGSTDTSPATANDRGDFFMFGNNNHVSNIVVHGGTQAFQQYFQVFGSNNTFANIQLGVQNTRQITAVSVAASTFTIAGDFVGAFPPQSSSFLVGQKFTVTGSTSLANNGTYTVASIALLAGNTVITTVEAIPSNAVAGYISWEDVVTNGYSFGVDNNNDPRGNFGFITFAGVNNHYVNFHVIPHRNWFNHGLAADVGTGVNIQFQNANNLANPGMDYAHFSNFTVYRDTVHYNDLPANTVGNTFNQVLFTNRPMLITGIYNLFENFKIGGAFASAGQSQVNTNPPTLFPTVTVPNAELVLLQVNGTNNLFSNGEVQGFIWINANQNQLQNISTFGKLLLTGSDCVVDKLLSLAVNNVAATPDVIALVGLRNLISNSRLAPGAANTSGMYTIGGADKNSVNSCIVGTSGTAGSFINANSLGVGQNILINATRTTSVNTVVAGTILTGNDPTF